VTTVSAASSTASGLVANHKIASPSAVRPTPNASPSCGWTRPSGSGRVRVRCMSASVSRSMNWFSA